jgi:16S rRNA (uracil1498-N3)-methyltransferase
LRPYKFTDMRDIRIYQPGHYQVGDYLSLSDNAVLHVAVVLRMQVDQRLVLFNGNNEEFLAQITAINKKKVTVLINNMIAVSRESSASIHLAQAIVKGARMEMVIQKAVELGVVSITPIITEHCAIKVDAKRLIKKQTQWQAIAVSACEQSGRNQIPIIHPIESLLDYAQKNTTSQRFVLSPKTTKKWHDYELSMHDIRLMIGPEGGFSHTELEVLSTHAFIPIGLGPRVLRTETAAIAALSVLQALVGDL